MTPDYRAMCAELLVLAEESPSYRVQAKEAVQLIDRARELLAEPGASNTYFEFVIFDADYCTQAEGIAPTYAQALSEGQHYLAQYQQDGPHTLELRRVEVLNPDALPTPEATND